MIEDFNKKFTGIYNSIIYNILRPALNKLYDGEISTNFKNETFII